MLSALLAGWWAWRLDSPARAGYISRTLSLFRLSVIPVAAYLLFTHTVHPWYVVFIVPLLVFLLPAQDGQAALSRFIWPWLYLSLAVPLSYLAYRDPGELQVPAFVRLVEYLPTFLLLAWSSWPWLSGGLAHLGETAARMSHRKRQ
jgi:hypothetical protein